LPSPVNGVDVPGIKLWSSCHISPFIQQESLANAKGTRDSTACTKTRCDQI